MILFSIALILLIGGLEYLHYKERKDLLNRIQAKDITEYKSLSKKPEKKKEKEKEPEPNFV